MFRVPDLIEDEEYEFRVVAENDAGAGTPSASTGTFRARDPFTTPGSPGKPLVSLTADATATLSWARPADDGRSNITHYQVGESISHSQMQKLVLRLYTYI
jgi:titin